MKTPLALLMIGFGLGFAPNSNAQVFDTVRIVDEFQTTKFYKSVRAADLDGDGDQDILFSAANAEGQIRWARNLGSGLFAPAVNLMSTLIKVRGFDVTDLDGDGDIDVVSSIPGGKIAWNENLGNGIFASGETIATTLGGPRTIKAGDLDGDGDLDLVFDSGLYGYGWIESLGGGVFGSVHWIEKYSPLHRVLDVADLDQDGDLDIVSGSYCPPGSEGCVGNAFWFENLGGGVFASRVDLAASVLSVTGIEAADINGDGDMDLLVTSDVHLITVGLYGTVSWIENLGGGQFGVAHKMPRPVFGAQGAGAFDFDGDGDLDVITSSRDAEEVVLFENLGAGTFALPTPVVKGLGVPAGVFAGDLDGDGDLDALVGYIEDSNGVTWHENKFIDVEDSLEADLHSLALAVGGTQTFRLRGPQVGDFYLLLGSLSGATPGVNEGPFNLPLNPDAYMTHTMTQIGAAPLSGALGVMQPGPSGGQAAASFILPPALDPALAGLVIYHAYLTVSPATLAVNFTSNAVPLILQ